MLENEYIPICRYIYKSVSENWLAASWYLIRLNNDLENSHETNYDINYKL